MPYHPVFTRLAVPEALAEVILGTAAEMAKQTSKAFRIESRRRSLRRGSTLRPGKETPLWNELRAQLKPYLSQYGQQVNLGRMLGLPRQRINAFITRGAQMPDAERTLQLLAWLMAVRQGKRPG